MANVTISYQWGDESGLTIDVEAENSYPDALDQARVTAVRGLREALADVVNLEGGDDA